METYHLIVLIEIHLPDDDILELPSHYHTTKGLPPNLLPTLILAFEMSQISFPDIINSLKPDLLIDGVIPVPKLRRTFW